MTGLKSQKRNPIRSLSFATLALLLLILPGGCTIIPAQTAAALLGRWQRLSPAGPGDPNQISAEYIEFRENGVLLTLGRDEGTENFWLGNSATYSLITSSQMQVTGTCWQGWKSYTCSRSYTIKLKGDKLKIFGDREAEYQRIGQLSPDLPPTLAPPFPSPTPQ